MRRKRVPVRTFVPIWMNPLMTANGDTFLSDVLDLVGAQNVFADRERRYPLAADLGRAAPLSAERVGDRDTRYPRVTLEEVQARQPELILLPDEPHAFTQSDAEVFRSLDVPAAKTGRIVFCDGKDLMWYGARSLEGLDRLRAARGS
jgi:ABC-type Fe3+-hydroxamate transport system substrate-binding protein